MRNADELVDILGHADKFLLAKATRGHGRGTKTDTVGGEGGLVTRGGVLVGSNVGSLENNVDASTVNLLGAEIHEDHVAVGAVRDELVSETLELPLEGLGVGSNKLLVFLVLGSHGLLESNGQGGDGVVVRTALVTREDGEVNLLLKIVEGLLALGIYAADTLAVEDHGTARATERLVGGGSDNVGIGEGRRNDASSNQTGNVGHVNNEVGANRVGNLTEAGIVNVAAIGGGTSNNDSGSVELGILCEGVVVNDTSLGIDSIGERLKVVADGRNLLAGDLVSVGQVTAVRKVKAHETAVKGHDGLIDLKVGRGTREGLNVHAPLFLLKAKSLKSTLLAETLNSVNMLVTGVVPLTGQSLRVLVRHGRPKGIKNGLGSDVLGSNENNRLALALNLVFLPLSAIQHSNCS